LSKRKVGKRKSKRTRKQPKCTLCNPFRWLGNTFERHRFSNHRRQKLPPDFLRSEKELQDV